MPIPTVYVGERTEITLVVTVEATGDPFNVTTASFTIIREDGTTFGDVLTLESPNVETISTGTYKVTIYPDVKGTWKLVFRANPDGANADDVAVAKFTVITP